MIFTFENLVSLPCWKARLGYANVFLLDIGEKIPCNSPKLKGEFKGEYTLEVLMGEWTITKHDSIFVSSIGLERIESVNGLDCEGGLEKNKAFEMEVGKIKCLQDLIVKRVSINDQELRFDFGDYELIVSNSDDKDVAAWRLFLPGHLMIEASKNNYQFARSDKVVK